MSYYLRLVLSITDYKMLTGPEEVYPQSLRKLGKVHIKDTSYHSEGFLKVPWIIQNF